MIFDSHYDAYKGVVAYVRVMEGRIRATETVRLMATEVDVKPVEIGYFSPGMHPVDVLNAGDVGYVATGLKTVRECRVGDTFTTTGQSCCHLLCLATAKQNQWFLPEFTR